MLVIVLGFVLIGMVLENGWPIDGNGEFKARTDSIAARVRLTVIVVICLFLTCVFSGSLDSSHSTWITPPSS